MLSLKHYEPISLISELNKFLETNNLRTNKSGDDSSVETSRWLPAVDIKEENECFKITADLPGVDPQQIEISMENNVLTLKGIREDTRQEEHKNYFRVERVKGEFYRRFTLPDTADNEKINAKSKHGVLEIIIPKRTIAQVRKINIATEE